MPKQVRHDIEKGIYGGLANPGQKRPQGAFPAAQIKT
jgi:hypothetical protein